MNLKKRIFRLNMVMLISSLIAMLVVSIYVVNNIYQNQNHFQSTAQKIAKSQQHIELFEGEDFTQLAKNLAPSGARLYVESNGYILYSNLEEQDKVEELVDISISSISHISYIDEEIIISRKIAHGGKIYYLYAILKDLEEQHAVEEFRLFIIQLVLVGGTGIVLVVLFNFFFTHRILSAIMSPLEKLQHSVYRIKKGDYDTPIIYKGDKEFEDLIEGFNQMQSSLLQAKEKNHLYEQNRTQMIANISHDLRTPLTSIKGYTKGILDGVANTSEKQTRYLTIIYQKTRIMEALLEKLFAFSQLDTDTILFHTVRVDLAEFLVEYIQEKSIELVEENTRFSLNISEPLFVEIDPIQFRRILDNLVDNSRKYSHVTPLLLSISGHIEDNEVVWTFTDNGQGVTKDKLHLLFEEFYREDETRQQVEGHGLGLAIVKNIVNRLGGHIEVTANPGLHFIFRLPRKDNK